MKLRLTIFLLCLAVGLVSVRLPHHSYTEPATSSCVGAGMFSAAHSPGTLILPPRSRLHRATVATATLSVREGTYTFSFPEPCVEDQSVSVALDEHYEPQRRATCVHGKWIVDDVSNELPGVVRYDIQTQRSQR